MSLYQAVVNPPSDTDHGPETPAVNSETLPFGLGEEGHVPVSLELAYFPYTLLTLMSMSRMRILSLCKALRLPQ